MYNNPNCHKTFTCVRTVLRLYVVVKAIDIKTKKNKGFVIAFANCLCSNNQQMNVRVVGITKALGMENI